MSTIRKHARKGIAAIVGVAAVAALAFGVTFANAAITNLNEITGDITTGGQTVVHSTVSWDDNMGGTERPDVDKWLSTEEGGWSAEPVYYYSLDGGETLVKLTSEDMERMGLTADDLAIDSTNIEGATAMVWEITSNFLPETVKEMEVDEDGNPVVKQEYPIQWFFAMDQDMDTANAAGYCIQAASEETAAAGDVINTILTDYQATISWADNSNLYDTRNNIDSSIFVVKRFVNGQTPDDAVTIDDAEVIVSAPADYEGELNNSNIWNLALKNLPMFDEQGDPYIYFIEVDTDNICDAEDGSYYLPEYSNNDVYTTYGNALYPEGEVALVLANITHFEVDKTWTDGNANNRPNCTLYLYRFAEGDAGAINLDQVLGASPVQHYDNTTVPKQDGTITMGVVERVIGEDTDDLPMYDALGHKYIYFALESGLTGDYVSCIDNSESVYSDTVEGLFNTGDIMRNGYPKYVLNGGSIDNALKGIDDLAATKIFVAPALQSIPAEVEMVLQHMDEQGNWVNATTDDIADPNQVDPESDSYIEGMCVNEDGSITVVVDDFSSEITEMTVAGLKAQRYDPETGVRQHFRWVETSITIGGVRTDVTFDENDGYSLANVDNAAPGTSTKNTDALFQPTAQVADSGHTTITNKLVGDAQLVLDKTWIENGVTLTAEQAAARGLSARIFVCQNGLPYDNPQLDINEGIAVLNGDNSYHMEALVPRYDENGMEYTYSFNELSVDGWFTQLVTTKDVVDVNGVDILQYKAAVSNVTGPGTTILLDVTKEYLDETDSDSRRPVRFAVYRANGQGGYDLFRGGDGDELWLTSDENWYQRISIPVPDGSNDTADNYIVREVSVGDVPVTYSADDATIASYEIDVPFGEAINPNELYTNDKIVGHAIEADGENAQNVYNYDVFIRHTHKNAYNYSERYYAGYTLSNRRVGSLNLDLSKSWAAGGATPVGTFVVTREIKATHAEDSSFRLEFELSPSSQSCDAYRVVTNTDQSIEVVIEDLPKYDIEGNLYEYSIAESKIGGVSLSNGYVVIDGDTYGSSVAPSGIELAGDELHHDGDVYNWNARNYRAQSYGLTANKVWRDYGTMNGVVDRPDVSFNVYRLAVSDATYAGLCNEDGSVNRAAVIQYAMDHNTASERQVYIEDYIWDTTKNDWFWTCNLGTAPRYDGNGNRFIYYLIEKKNGDNGAYATGYCNGNEQPNGSDTVTSTQEVFTTPNEDLNPEILLLADGMTDGSSLSKTVVNYRTGDRTLSGMKLWHLPEGWAVPLPDMPVVNVELYRSIEGTQSLAEASYSSEDFIQRDGKTYINLNGTEIEVVKVNSVVLNEDGQGNYRYNFTEDADGNTLPEYTEYGEFYSYFVHETSTDPLHNYGDRDVSGNNTYFSIVNTYTFDDIAEIDLHKTYVDAAVPAVGTENLAPAKFELYAQAVNGRGANAGQPVLMSTAIVIPQEGEDGRYTYDFTFKYYTRGVDANGADFNADLYDNLPYFGPTNHPFKYYIVEAPMPNGYSVNPATLKSDYIAMTLDEETNVASGETSFTNTYDGGDTNFTAKKTWTDGNNVDLDNTVYRPDAITFDVYRYWSSATVNDIQMSGNAKPGEFYQTVTVDAASNWQFKLEHIDKYAPDGAQYTYYIDKGSEHFICYQRNADGSIKTDAQGNPLLDTEKAATLQAMYTAANGTGGNANTTVGNTLSRTHLTVNKTWASTAGNTLNQEALSKLHEMGAIPDSMTYTLQQSIAGGEWTNVVNKNGVVISKTVIWDKFGTVGNGGINDAGTKWDITGLPNKTLDGQAISYRIVETFGALTAVNTGTNPGTGSGQIMPGTDFAGGTVSGSGSGTGIKFTNTIDMTKITLIKIWDDNHNQDNTRPNSVTFQVTVGEGTDASVTNVTINTQGASANDQFNNSIYVPQLLEGKELGATYIVTENSVPTKYTLSAGPTWTGNSVSITNKLTPPPNDERVNVTANKIIGDEHGWTGVIRPTIKFQLEYLAQGSTSDWLPVDGGDAAKAATGMETDSTVTLQFNGNNASVAYNNLYRFWTYNTTYGIAELIHYKVVETMYDEAGNVIATASYPYNANTNSAAPNPANSGNYTASITNNPKLGQLWLQKKWTTNNGTAELTAAQINALVASGDLPQNLYFQIQYRDTTINDAGEVAWNDWANTGDVITKASASLITPVSLGSNFPLIDKNGQAIEYRVVELESATGPAIAADSAKTIASVVYNVGGGAATVIKPGNAAGASTTAVITNSVQLGSIEVSKTWADDSQRDGAHPNSVVVSLYRDGTYYAQKTISGPSWSATFNDLPVMKADGSGQSEWSIAENGSDERGNITLNNLPYSVSYTGNNVNLTDGGKATVGVTNTHIPDEGSISVTKVWNDGDIATHEAIQVQLMGYTTNKNQAKQYGTATLSAENNWTYTWSNLKLNEPVAQRITYFVQETAPDGYSYTCTEAQAQKDETVALTLTNTLLGSIQVNKVWVDAGNPDRPADVTISVRNAASQQVVGSVTLNANNNWSGSVSGLPVYDAQGNAIAYNVVELNVPAGYTVAYQGENISIITPNPPVATVTNTSDEFPRVNVTASKTFEGDEDFAEITRPEIGFQLWFQDQATGAWTQVTEENKAVVGLGADESAYKVAEFNGDNYADVTWNGLFRYWPTSSRANVQYKVVEILDSGAITLEQSGYTSDETEIVLTPSADGDYTADFVNTLETEDVRITKSWTTSKSGEAAAIAFWQAKGVIPYTIQVNLQYSADNGNSWFTWNDEPYTLDVLELVDGVDIASLPAKDGNGADLIWRAAEVDGDTNIAGQPYQGIFWGEAAELEGGVFALENVVPTGDLVVEKQWGAGDHPQSVSITLFADGEEIETVTLNEGNGWSHTWPEMQVYRDGSNDKITYSIVETAIAGFQTHYLAQETELVVDGTANLIVKNVEGSRDENEVNVYATKVFDGDTDWYTLTRPNLAFKLWYYDTEGVAHEADAAVGLKPGDSATKQVTFTENGVGEVSWTGLLRYWTTEPEEGEEASSEGTGDLIRYYVEEIHVGGVPYHVSESALNPEPTAEMDEDGNYKFYYASVTNTLDTAPVTVVKNWTFAGEQLTAEQVADFVEKGFIPENLDIALQYNNGAGWTTWGNVRTYSAAELMTGVVVERVPASDRNGVTLSWRFVEVNADGTEINGQRVLASIYGDAAIVTPGGSATLTNTVELGSIAITKAWDDANDVAGKRPDEITVYIYRDGNLDAPYRTVTLAAANNWTLTVDELPVYKDGSTDKSEYLVTEQDLSRLEYAPTYTGNEGIILTTGETAEVGIENVLPMAPVDLDKVVYINETCSQNEALPVDATMPLAGATFTISTQDGSKLIETVTSDANGHVTFSKLPDGTYLVKEIDAPKPNKVNNDDWYAVIQGGEYVGLVDANGEAIEANEITDDVYRGSISITKVEEGDPGMFVPGCTFALYRVGEGDGRMLVAEATTDADGHLTFDGLLTGVKYEIVETSAAAGYYVSSNAVTFSLAVDEDGNVTVAEFDGGNGTAELVDAEEGAVTWNNPPVVVNIIKVDENGKALAGAKLQLTDADGNVVDTWTSTGEAYVLRGVLTAGQTYTLTELSAPEGYLVAKPVTFTVEDRTVGPNEELVIEVKMVDPRKPVTPGTRGYDKTGGTTLPLMILAIALIVAGLGTGAYGYRNRRKPQHEIH